MKLKDIEVGKEYAYQRGENWHAERVRVVAVGVQTMTYGAFREPRPTGPANRVAIENMDGTKPFHSPVPAAHIRRTWAEQEEVNREAARSRAASKEREARLERRCAAVVEVLRGCGVQASASVGRFDAGSVRITLEEAEKLTTLLNKASAA